MIASHHTGKPNLKEVLFKETNNLLSPIPPIPTSIRLLFILYSTAPHHLRKRNLSQSPSLTRSINSHLPSPPIPPTTTSTRTHLKHNLNPPPHQQNLSPKHPPPVPPPPFPKPRRRPRPRRKRRRRRDCRQAGKDYLWRLSGLDTKFFNPSRTCLSFAGNGEWCRVVYSYSQYGYFTRDEGV